MLTEHYDGHVGEPKPGQGDSGYRTYPVKGSIIAVYPTDDENHSQGQVLCDVVCFDMERTLLRVPVLSPAFHQDTDPSDLRGRQNLPPRERNIYDGEGWIPAVGTLCVVMWVGRPPNAEPFISHFIPTNFQSLPHPGRRKNIFPREAQAVTKFNSKGEPEEELSSRLQPTEAEAPRYVRVQNGSAFEIDNRGNVTLQATINKEPIRKERYSGYHYEKPMVETTPEPEGNVVLSTRGAKRGNIGLITGRLKSPSKSLIVFQDGEQHVVPIDETNEEGSILLKTVGAGQGDIDLEVRTVNRQTGEVMGSGVVHLGSRTADHPAVLGDRLLKWIADKLMSHTHGNVRPGGGRTGPPSLTAPDILSRMVFVEKG